MCEEQIEALVDNLPIPDLVALLGSCKSVRSRLEEPASRRFSEMLMNYYGIVYPFSGVEPELKVLIRMALDHHYHYPKRALLSHKPKRLAIPPLGVPRAGTSVESPRPPSFRPL